MPPSVLHNRLNALKSKDYLYLHQYTASSQATKQHANFKSNMGCITFEAPRLPIASWLAFSAVDIDQRATRKTARPGLDTPNTIPGTRHRQFNKREGFDALRSAHNKRQ
jgi:hypothetical protein